MWPGGCFASARNRSECRNAALESLRLSSPPRFFYFIFFFSLQHYYFRRRSCFHFPHPRIAEAPHGRSGDDKNEGVREEGCAIEAAA